MRKLFFTGISLILSICIYAQSPVFTIKPAKIEAGKDVRFTYTGKLAKKGTKIEVKLYNALAYDIKNIQTKFTGKSIVGTINIPDSIIYVSFGISNGGKTDKKDKESVGFDYNVYKNGKPVKGTNLVHGVLLSRLGGGNKAIDLIEKEYMLYPEQREKTVKNYLYIISNIKERKAEATLLAKKLFDEGIQKGAPEEDLTQYIRYIYNSNYKMRDSLEQVIISKYPKGSVSFLIRMDKVYSEKDPDQALQMVSKMEDEYPERSKLNRETLNNLRINAYVKKKDYANFDKYIATGINKENKSQQYNQIAWNMATSDVNLPLAKTYSEKCIATMDSFIKFEKPERISTKEWEKNMNPIQGNNYDTYAYILEKLGNIKEAAEKEQYGVVLSMQNNTYMNEQLMKYLITLNQTKEALNWGAKFLSSDKSSAKLDSLYDVAYIKQNGSKTGLEAAKAKLFSNMKSAPDFTLKTLDGKVVTLSALKGKIVILDFWATWCGPCLASFPGMQKAVDALKGDKDVCFFFINTSERTDANTRLNDIKRTIKDKNVNFTVLLDEQKGDDYKVNSLYKVTGIPTKFVIDKNGKIRSTIVGYNDNEQAMVNEIKQIVQRLK